MCKSLRILIARNRPGLEIFKQSTVDTYLLATKSTPVYNSSIGFNNRTFTEITNLVPRSLFDEASFVNKRSGYEITISKDKRSIKQRSEFDQT